MSASDAHGRRMIVMGMPNDTDVLAAIGKIAVRHGQLDHILRMTVKTLTGVEVEDALDATARQASKGLRERVRKLARARLGDGDAFVRLEAILERARRATTKRNELLHSLWAQELDGAPVMQSHDHSYRDIPTAQELETVADTLAQIAGDLNFARLKGFLSQALQK